MSIREKIALRVHEKKLFCLGPRVRSDPVVRTLFVSTEVLENVLPPFAAHHDGYRLTQFRATLDTFTRGDLISVAERPQRKAPNAFMARTDPVSAEIWDIRSMAPIPGIRAFGAFSEKDTFIALTWDYRENIDWNVAVAECATEWDKLLGPCPRVKRKSLDEYLSHYRAV